jgi:hypothetical protein
MEFANRVLRKIFGSKKDTVTGDWKKFYAEELHDLYSSAVCYPGYQVKNKIDGRVVYRVCRRQEVDIGFRWANLRERGHLADLGIDGRILLELELKEMGWKSVDWFDLAQVTDKLI